MKIAMTEKRNRLVYAVAIGLVIALGLASRSSLACHIPSFIAIYAGDTLWALTVFMGLGFVFPRIHTTIIALLTIAISFSVEFSQLYQADWINAIRNTKIGALALGAGFKWSDLLCYTTGCIIGTAGEFVTKILLNRRK